MVGTFADGIMRVYEPLNNIEAFKEKYKEESFKILLNPKDGRYAALIIVDHGTLTVESIENKPKENLDKKILKWDASMRTKIQMFKDIGDGKLSSKDITKKVITGKIKVKNPKFLIKFSELGSILREN